MFSDILLTVDYDRTLTAPDSSIPARNLEAISYFMENGGTFTVNTGRSVPMSREHIIPKVPVNAPLLLYNGSADYDVTAKKFTRFVPIDVDASALVADLIEHFPMLGIEVQSEDAHYMVRKNPGWDAYCAHNHCASGYVTVETVPLPLVKIAVNGEFRAPTVANMYEATEEDLEIFDRLEAYMQEHYGDKIAAFRACPRILDLHAKGCSKLHSARALQKQLGKKILVCVGDSKNDIAMLDGADFAYCPSDGVLADRYENVCPCGDGAVADVIYHKLPLLIQK